MIDSVDLFELRPCGTLRFALWYIIFSFDDCAVLDGYRKSRPLLQQIISERYSKKGYDVLEGGAQGSYS